MTHEFTTDKAVCAKQITFDLDEDKVVSNINFEGGCNGNLKGICALAEGKNAGDIVDILKGIKCGKRATSCPEQLAIALEEQL